MARAAHFSTPTKLYHPTQGERVFGVGEQDPGNAWSDKPGGDTGSATTESALKDLIAAQEGSERMGRQVASAQHDAAQADRRAAEAVAALAESNQRAVDADKARVAAEEVAAQSTRERDMARGDVENLKGRIAQLEAEIETLTAPAKPAKTKEAA